MVLIKIKNFHISKDIPQGRLKRQVILLEKIFVIDVFDSFGIYKNLQMDTTDKTIFKLAKL